MGLSTKQTGIIHSSPALIYLPSQQTYVVNIVKPLCHSGSHALGLGPNVVNQTLTLNCWQEQRRMSG